MEKFRNYAEYQKLAGKYIAFKILIYHYFKFRNGKSNHTVTKKGIIDFAVNTNGHPLNEALTFFDAMAKEGFIEGNELGGYQLNLASPVGEASPAELPPYIPLTIPVVNPYIPLTIPVVNPYIPLTIPVVDPKLTPSIPLAIPIDVPAEKPLPATKQEYSDCDKSLKEPIKAKPDNVVGQQVGSFFTYGPRYCRQCKKLVHEYLNPVQDIDGRWYCNEACLGVYEAAVARQEAETLKKLRAFSSFELGKD